MARAGINCCSKSASTTCPDLSGNVSKDFNCFNDHAKPAFVIAFVSDSGFLVLLCNSINLFLFSQVQQI